MQGGSNVKRRSFLVERRSVPAARRFVVSALDEWNLLGIAHVALLLTSELATNALIHAGTEFHVTAAYHEDRCLRVEVLDGDTKLPSRAVIPVDASSGRGLNVVRALARSWGAETRPEGKVVWFELSLPAPRR